MTLTKTFGIGSCVGFEGLVGLDDASGGSGLVGLDDASGGLVGLDDVSKGNAETSTGGGVLDLSSGIHQYRSSMTIRQAAWTARNQPSATHLPHSPSHLY